MSEAQNNTEGYFLAEIDNNANAIDLINGLAIALSGEKWLSASPGAALAEEKARGMPEGLPYTVYRVKVEKVEQTV